MSTFSERVQLIIDLRFGGKQKSLANAMGVSEPAVFKWLNGTIPREPTLQAICKIAHVTYSWLTTGEGDMDEPSISDSGNFIAKLTSMSISDPDHIGRLLEMIAKQDPVKFRVVCDMILAMCQAYSDQQEKDGE